MAAQIEIKKKCSNQGSHGGANGGIVVPPLSLHWFRFGVFEVDPRTWELRRDGVKIRLHRKSFQLLLMLIERPGEILPREEIRAGLWPADTFVDFDSNIKTALNKLRQSLGDVAENPIFIETVPKVGCRFIAPVTRLRPIEWSSADAARGLSLDQDPASGSSPPRVISHRFRQSNRIWRFSAIAVLGFLVMSAVYYRTRLRLSPAHSSLRPVIVLVLPFDNLSGDASQEFFSDGITDEMISLLGQLAPRQLAVIARTSAMQYRGVHKPLSRIAKELGGADYALEGSVRRFGHHVAINTELLRVPDGVVLWAQSYERNLDDLLAVQQDVAERISQSLLQKLVPLTSSSSLSEVDSRAHDAYLMGLYYQANKRDGQNLLASVGYFKHAIQEDPQYASAFAALAYSYALAAGWEVMDPKDAYPRAKAAAEQALQLDPNLVEARVALASVEHEYYWKWGEVEPEFRRAIELDPNSSLSHKEYAEFLMHAGRNAEAIQEVNQAVALDPLALGTRLLRAFVYLFARDYEHSAQECEAIIQADSQFAPAHYLLGGVYALQGQFNSAITHLKLAQTLTNGSSKMSAGLARGYAAAGRRQDAWLLLSELERYAKQSYVSPYSMADAYLCLGDKDHAIDLLNQAVAEHSSDLLYLRYSPDFESLHDDPRFVRLIHKIGFPTERQYASKFH